MSKLEVPKLTRVTICDYCDEEISEDDLSQWAHIVRDFVSRDTQKAKYLKFLSPSKVTFTAVVYDFHAACFDTMMQKLKQDKQGAEL